LVQNRDYRKEIRGEGLALGPTQRLQKRDKGRRTSSSYRT
jgi:hypothetical protein